MPQPKKHASTRARRNKATTAATLQSGDDSAERSVPPLMERDEGWHPESVRYWENIWRSPMPNEWHGPTDAYNVLVMIGHFDDWVRADNAADRQKADTALMKRQTPLGLEPYGRRRLEWSFEIADEAKARGEQRRSRKSPEAPSPASGGKADPRVALSVVS